MLAIIIGDLSLLLGLGVLLMPLLLTELSRPRDLAWAAIILILGLLLVANHDRFNGSSILAVVLGSLVISRLGVEVAQGRWQQLSDEEKLRLGSFERWMTGFKELIAAFFHLGKVLGDTIKFPVFNKKGSSSGKKWIRPESDAEQSSTNEFSKAINQELETSKEPAREKL